MSGELETQAEGQRNLPLFMLQQVLIPPLTFILGLFIAAPFEPRGYDPVLKWPYSFLHAFPAVVGFPLAYLINRLWWRASRSGRWIWILPCVAWSYDVFLVGTRLPLSERLANEFAPSGGTEGLALALVTIPALACLLYSLGMAIISTRRRSSG